MLQLVFSVYVDCTYTHATLSWSQAAQVRDEPTCAMEDGSVNSEWSVSSLAFLRLAETCAWLVAWSSRYAKSSVPMLVVYV